MFIIDALAFLAIAGSITAGFMWLGTMLLMLGDNK